VALSALEARGKVARRLEDRLQGLLNYLKHRITEAVISVTCHVM
jgi:hypothetical protein